MADFFVIRETALGSGHWAHVYNTAGNSPLFTAADATTANGLAAISLGNGGKFAAFDVTTATVDDETIEEVATPTPGSFLP